MAIVINKIMPAMQLDYIWDEINTISYGFMNMSRSIINLH